MRSTMGAFRRPDQALAAGSVVVVLEVQLQHQAAPHAAVGKPALDQHQAIMAAQPALRQATAHRFVDALDPKRLVVGGQVDLGEDHVQRRRRVADLAGHSRPVRRLAGVLVAGDHAPAGEVQPLAGQQQARGAENRQPCSWRAMMPHAGRGALHARSDSAGVGTDAWSCLRRPAAPPCPPPRGLPCRHRCTTAKRSPESASRNCRRGMRAPGDRGARRPEAGTRHPPRPRGRLTA
jgi:hypothetical protein